MTQNIITAGDATNTLSITGGNDGTVVIQSGLAGSKVNALSFAADGTPTFLKGPVNVVAFSAYQSTLQSVPNATLTKIQFQTKEYDTASAFDSTTNYRFQPLVAGYYQISANVGFVAAVQSCLATLYKNGSRYKDGVNAGSAAGYLFSSNLSAQVYLNGSTDYLEIFGYQAIGSPLSTQAAPYQTFFQGILIAKA